MNIKQILFFTFVVLLVHFAFSAYLNVRRPRRVLQYFSVDGGKSGIWVWVTKGKGDR